MYLIINIMVMSGIAFIHADLLRICWLLNTSVVVACECINAGGPSPTHVPPFHYFLSPY